MADSIPPVLSDSPPPLCEDQDDNDVDDGFGYFGIAADLGFDHSDNSRDSPEVWNTPSTNSNSDPLNEVLTEKKKPDNDSASYQESSTILEDSPSPVDKISNQVGDARTSADNVLCSEIPDNPAGVIADDACDLPEIVRELEEFSSFTVPCITDVHLEERPSPEGADAESPPYDFRPVEHLTKEEELSYLKPLVLSDDLSSHVITSECCEIPLEAPDKSPSPNHDRDCKIEAEDDGFDDFADFTSQPFPSEAPTSLVPEPKNVEAVSQNEIDDDFDDFDDFECAVPSEPHVEQSTFLPQTSSTLAQPETIETRLAAIFASAPEDNCAFQEDKVVTRCLNTCLDDSSSVWGRLKHLDTSPALTLSWPSSSASRKMLTALSVDSRNILVSQRWNSFVPRYAASIGAPLEPTKIPDTVFQGKITIPDQETDVEVTTPSIGVVPAAQFDWTSSGLTNPLDCVEKKEAPTLQQNELTMKEDSSTLSPSNDLWPLAITPTDVNLLSASENVTSEIRPTSSQSKDKVPEDSNRDLKETLDSSSQWGGPSGMSTISGQFESVQWGTTTQKALSPEASQVVESFPDLSFLSARKLLFTANENLSRYQAMARP